LASGGDPLGLGTVQGTVRGWVKVTQEDPQFGSVGVGDDLAILISHWRAAKGYPERYPGLRAAAGLYHVGGSDAVTVRVGEQGDTVSKESGSPSIVLPVGISLVEPGDKVTEGQLITGVTIAWWRIIEELDRNPQFLYRLHEIGWRAVEELIAGGWERNKWDVILTPRSKDGGRDIIAKRSDIAGWILVMDQTKAYRPGNIVTADDVRAMSALLLRPDVTKVFVTTTSDFAPGVYTDTTLAPLMPNRLELRNGRQTREWLLANPPSA